VRALEQLGSPRLAQVGGAFPICPSADWAGTHGPPPPENYATGWAQPFICHNFIGQAMVGSLPAASLKKVWLSPASKTIDEPARLFKGFPSTLIIAGAAELTLLPMRTLRDRIIAGSGQAVVTYREYEDSTHDFIAFDWCEPQRSQALEDFGKWLVGIYQVGSL
jgi:hypothetical protein